jgi:hypothetical protein
MKQIASVPGNQNPHFLIKECDLNCYHIRLIRRGYLPGNRRVYQESNEVQVFQVNDWLRLTSDPDWLKKTGFARYEIIHDPLKR